MCTVHTVISIAVIASITCTTSSLDTTHQSSIRSVKYRRFLFTQNQSINMCTMFCPLVCPQGYVQSTSGCFQCKCATTSSYSTTVSSQNITTVRSTSQQYTLYNGGVFLSNPCNPAVRHCRQQCLHGYQEGFNGCQYCACLSSTTNQISTSASTDQSTSKSQGLQTIIRPRVTQSTMVSTIESSLPVVIQKTTSPIMKATITSLKRTTIPPTSKPTTVRTTTTTATKMTITTTEGTNFNDPCIPSHKRCTKRCNGNYVKGPGGCQYCLCARNIPPELRTTTASPNSKFGMNATIPHYLDLSPTSEACILAKVICNQKCDDGFISHPDDCLFCSCRKQADDPGNEVSNYLEVTLSNPCVQHSAICGLKCSNGYVIGPRGCKFCSCRP